MEDTEKSVNKFKLVIWIGVPVVLVYIVIVIVFPLIFDSCISQASFGQFGDAFGLFNSLAFIVALIVIFQQNEDLKLTRKELAKSSKAQQELVKLQKRNLDKSGQIFDKQSQFSTSLIKQLQTENEYKDKERKKDLETNLAKIISCYLIIKNREELFVNYIRHITTRLNQEGGFDILFRSEYVTESQNMLESIYKASDEFEKQYSNIRNFFPNDLKNKIDTLNKNIERCLFHTTESLQKKYLRLFDEIYLFQSKKNSNRNERFDSGLTTCLNSLPDTEIEVYYGLLKSK